MLQRQCSHGITFVTKGTSARNVMNLSLSFSRRRRSASTWLPLTSSALPPPFRDPPALLLSSCSVSREAKPLSPSLLSSPLVLQSLVMWNMASFSSRWWFPGCWYFFTGGRPSSQWTNALGIGAFGAPSGFSFGFSVFTCVAMFRIIFWGQGQASDSSKNIPSVVHQRHLIGKLISALIQPYHIAWFWGMGSPGYRIY